MADSGHVLVTGGLGFIGAAAARPGPRPGPAAAGTDGRGAPHPPRPPGTDGSAGTDVSGGHARR